MLRQNHPFLYNAVSIRHQRQQEHGKSASSVVSCSESFSTETSPSVGETTTSTISRFSRISAPTSPFSPRYDALVSNFTEAVENPWTGSPISHRLKGWHAETAATRSTVGNNKKCVIHHDENDPDSDDSSIDSLEEMVDFFPELSGPEELFPLHEGVEENGGTHSCREILVPRLDIQPPPRRICVPYWQQQQKASNFTSKTTSTTTKTTTTTITKETS